MSVCFLLFSIWYEHQLKNWDINWAPRCARDPFWMWAVLKDDDDDGDDDDADDDDDDDTVWSLGTDKK